ncbi:hypothetical protein IFM89_023351, partial [Coptis chinensis]
FGAVKKTRTHQVSHYWNHNSTKHSPASIRCSYCETGSSFRLCLLRSIVSICSRALVRSSHLTLVQIYCTVQLHKCSEQVTVNIQSP